MLELKGENPFKVKAYENGARAVLGMDQDLAEAVQSGTLRQVPGIGAGLSSNIETLVRTGTLPYYEELKAAFPPGLRECIRVPGFSARKAKQVFDTLGVDSLDSLEEACRSGRIAALKGFGAKTAGKILSGIAIVRAGVGLHKYSRGAARAEETLKLLQAMRLAERVEIAGEIRRRCEIVPGVVFLAAAENPVAIRRAFRELPGIAEPFAEPENAREDAPVRVRFGGGLLGDLVVVPPTHFGAAWLQATGSGTHLEALTSRASERGLRLEANGLYQGRAKKPLASKSEEEIYETLGLSWIPPELREGHGEVDAAAGADLPELVRREDLQGLIHVHTTESDGRDSLEDMNGFLAVLKKEAKQMLRDRGTLRLTLLVPAFQLVLFGLIDTNVKHVRTVVLDLSRTEESRQLVRDFTNTSLFDVVEFVPSRQVLRDRIVAARASVGIEIPPDYARRRLNRQPADFLVMVDGSDSSIASQALAAANGVTLSRSIAELLVRGAGKDLPIRIHPLFLFNPDSRSANLLIPGLVAILLTFSGTLLAAYAIVRERERGTLEQLMRIFDGTFFSCRAVKSCRPWPNGTRKSRSLVTTSVGVLNLSIERDGFHFS